MRPVFLVAAALLAGCSKAEPTVIDGSSAESFERTTKAARREIPDADRIIFDRALRTIGGRRHSVRDPSELARVTFDGMTAAEVVEDQKSHQARGD